MSRALAQGGYTEPQIYDRLSKSEGRVSYYFQVCDRFGNVLGTLPTGDAGVVNGTVQLEFNAENDIKGQLRFDMRPFEPLRNQAFKRLIRPVFRMTMDDGGSVQWPMGEFIWTTPERSVWRNDEMWTVLIGDKTQLLDYGGPGLSGFSVSNGENFSSAVNRALAAGGVTSTVPAFPITLGANRTWALQTPRTIKRWESQVAKLQKSTRPRDKRRAKNIQRKIDQQNLDLGQTTYLSIINDICEDVAANQIGFRYDGTPHFGYAADPYALPPLYTFTMDPLSGMIVSRVETSIDYSDIANRVFVNATTSGTAPLEVNANTYFPTHPLSQANIGIFIDMTIDKKSASDNRTIVGKKKLTESLGSYERVTFDCLIHPAFEVYDVIGLNVPEDPQFSSTAKLWVRQIQFDLDAAQMSFECLRVY